MSDAPGLRPRPASDDDRPPPPSPLMAQGAAPVDGRPGMRPEAPYDGNPYDGGSYDGGGRDGSGRDGGYDGGPRPAAPRPPAPGTRPPDATRAYDMARPVSTPVAAATAAPARG